jgi:transcriptional regulator with XRE-family HTH domain
MKKSHAQVVGERIAQAREKLKREGKPATQEWLAEAVGVGQRAISNYENGEREPDLEMLAKLAIALECDPVWLGALDKERHRTRREELLLELFRNTDTRGQDVIMRIAESQPEYMTPADKKEKRG